MSDPPGVVSSLPDRPLTRSEAAHLEDHESSSFLVRPESIIMENDQELVIALAVVNREKNRLYLVGYNHSSNGWEVVETWEKADLDKTAFYERLETWEGDNFS